MGIYLQKQSPLSLARGYASFILLTTIFLSLAIFLLVLFFKKNIWLSLLASIPFFFLLGALALAYQIHTYKNQQQKIPQEKTFFTARILDKKQKNFTLSVKKPFKGKISCYCRRQNYLKPGDLVHFKNVTLTQPKNFATITGNPTFTDYLIKENILATLFVKKQNCKIISEQNWSLAKKRHELYTALQEKIPPKTFVYFSSIFLGNKNQSPPRDQFYYSGTAHHLARSGLHVALFILVWTILLSLIPLPFTLKHLILISACTTYTLLSWTSTSFTRALGIFLLYQLGRILNKQTNLLYFLQLIAFAILLFNPMQLFFLDFQLSFGITAALAWAFQPRPNRRKPPKTKAKTPIPCLARSKFSNIK